MARTNTTASTVTPTNLDELVDRLYAGQKVEQLPSDGVGFGSKVASFFGDRVADSGDIAAELGAGFVAAGRNYSVAHEAALERQKLRTKRRISDYLAKAAK